MPIDFATDHGQRALTELQDELSIWLITVSPSGEPQPNPVWFVWEDESFLIWTMPDSRRIANIKTNPKVSLALPGDDALDEVTVFNGIAEFDDSLPPIAEHTGYTEKYKDQWERIGMDPVETSAAYSVGIRVTPSRMRGY